MAYWTEEDSVASVRAKAKAYLAESAAKEAAEAAIQKMQAEIAPEPEPEDEAPVGTRCLLYFIRAGRSGPIKIGITRDLERRISALQTAHHARLILLGHAPGNEETERQWHARFAEARLMGEWFKPTQKLLLAIAAEADFRFAR